MNNENALMEKLQSIIKNAAFMLQEDKLMIDEYHHIPLNSEKASLIRETIYKDLEWCKKICIYFNQLIDKDVKYIFLTTPVLLLKSFVSDKDVKAIVRDYQSIN